MALLALGRHEEALAACDEAVRIEPWNANCHSGRAAALGYLGRLEGALAACGEAERLCPGHANAAGVRKKVQEMTGGP